MTHLTKPVRRVTSATSFERGTKRIIVTLLPKNGAQGAQGERIAFRLERTRREYAVDLAGLFEQVVMMAVDAKRRAFERRVKELVKSGMQKRKAKTQARQEQE